MGKLHYDFSMTKEEIQQIHSDLRYLASLCDGAQDLDGQGFNRFDTDLGRNLAWQSELSEQSAIQARRMLVKYRRQLEAR